jgi:hypothetical protein
MKLGAGRQDLSGVAVDEFEAECRRAVAEAAEDAGSLLERRRISPGILIHEVAFEHSIHENRQLAGRRGDGLRLADAGGQSAIERAERGVAARNRQGGQAESRRRAIGRKAPSENSRVGPPRFGGAARASTRR